MVNSTCILCDFQIFDASGVMEVQLNGLAGELCRIHLDTSTELISDLKQIWEAGRWAMRFRLWDSHCRGTPNGRTAEVSNDETPPVVSCAINGISFKSDQFKSDQDVIRVYG